MQRNISRHSVIRIIHEGDYGFEGLVVRIQNVREFYSDVMDPNVVCFPYLGKWFHGN